MIHLSSAHLLLKVSLIRARYSTYFPAALSIVCYHASMRAETIYLFYFRSITFNCHGFPYSLLILNTSASAVLIFIQ